MYRNELYHYGVKGMRWGVRRYENYPGSYTQKGVKSFKEQSDKYDSARNSYLETKRSYKAGSATKLSLNESKQSMRTEKRKMKDAYKHLKQDKLGDQGKELYAKGKRITFNNNMYNLMATGGAAVSYMLYKSGKEDLSYKTAAATGAVTAGMYIANEYQNRRLRAYYGHSAWKG